MAAIASIIGGISTTAAGTLNSAELSFQQAIRSPTATANGNDRLGSVVNKHQLTHDPSMQNLTSCLCLNPIQRNKYL
jgi:hypothetical protein